MDIVYSVNRVPIRLWEERWEYIVRNKPYMEAYYDKVLKAIEDPTWVLRGHAGTLVAVLSMGYLHVVYREFGPDDGEVSTAFISRKLNQKMVIWPQNS